MVFIFITGTLYGIAVVLYLQQDPAAVCVLVIEINAGHDAARDLDPALRL